MAEGDVGIAEPLKATFELLGSGVGRNNSLLGVVSWKH